MLIWHFKADARAMIEKTSLNFLAPAANQTKPARPVK